LTCQREVAIHFTFAVVAKDASRARLINTIEVDPGKNVTGLATVGGLLIIGQGQSFAAERATAPSAGHGHQPRRCLHPGR
jgi:hypothetical protein